MICKLVRCKLQQKRRKLKSRKDSAKKRLAIAIEMIIDPCSCKYPVLVDDSLPPTPPPTTLAPRTWSATTSPAGSCAKLTDYPPWQREKQLKTGHISEASTFSVQNGTQLYTTIYTDICDLIYTWFAIAYTL